MVDALQHFKDNLSKNLYGMTRKEAIEKGICVRCKVPPPENMTFIEKSEYNISGLCGTCWTVIFSEGKEANEK